MDTIFVNTIAGKERREIQSADCQEMLTLCGFNTGNVCFVDAMQKQISYDRSFEFNEAIDYNGPYSRFILPASNWINRKGFVLKGLFLPMKNKSLSLTVAGLGIQTEQGVETPRELVKTLDEETVRALKIMSERSVSIGLRGYFSAEVLDLLGIHNWRVIGCPSFYESFRKQGGGYTELQKGSDRNPVCNVTPGNYVGKLFEYKVVELAVNESASLVMQDMRDLPLTLFQNLDIQDRHIAARFPGLKVGGAELTRYVRNHGKMFFTKDSWDDYLVSRKITFSYGSRFHGNMVAFTNGIPALWIKHDGRTSELIDALHLPYITYQQLENVQRIEELVDLCEYNHAFYKHYGGMCNEYLQFLEENELRWKPATSKKSEDQNV